MCAIVVSIADLGFVRFRWWTSLGGEIGSGVEVDIAWGFGCAVVGVMFIATCGRRWRGMKRNVVV